MRHHPHPNYYAAMHAAVHSMEVHARFEALVAAALADLDIPAYRRSQPLTVVKHT